MLYRKDREGRDLSALGFGCMRFSRKGGSIDQEEAEREIIRAVELGINYFDTAYIYPGSEACLGTVLEKHALRDRVFIATKLPQYLIRSREAIERYFREQLSRLRTDHVDFYLMHMLTDLDAWRKLQALGIESWIREKKQSGAIGQIGFSFHGNTSEFLRILEAYDWDFCQIQYNYIDEVSQAGRKGLQAAAAKGIPVVIMEPLRGGKLVSLLPQEARQLIAADPKKRSAAEIAFRWLWDQPEVTCVLSGMNSLEMVEENCRIASDAPAGSFTDEDRDLVERLRRAINARIRVGCTGCAYCMPCPQGVDIPGVFSCYNKLSTEGRTSGLRDFVQSVAMRRDPVFPSQCVACGRCEKHCPQHLPIIQELKKADKALRPLWVRGVIGIGRWWLFKISGKDRSQASDH